VRADARTLKFVLLTVLCMVVLVLMVRGSWFHDSLKIVNGKGKMKIYVYKCRF